MKNINISRKKYFQIQKLILPNDVMSTEADLLTFEYCGKIKVFKSFKNHTSNGAKFANKLYTVQMLDTYKEILPNSFVIPDSLCSVSGNIEGFTLPYIEGVNMEHYLNDKKISPKEKLYFIKRIGLILEQMDHIRQNTNLKSLFINDLHASNFIIQKDKGEVKIVDLDSCKICDNKSFPARYLGSLGLFNAAPYNKYILEQKDSEKKYDHNNYEDYYGYVCANANSDLYCYTILFLNFLYGSNINLFSINEFYDYMYYLGKIGIDKNLVNALYKIVSSGNNENIYAYLDLLTEEQVYRADKKVYKTVKKI